MNRVKAIREDTLVGIGSCSTIDECLTDIEVRDLLDEDNITIPYDAVSWARDRELFYLENATNYRWGSDDDPQLSAYHSFKKRMKDNPISLLMNF
jgi:hypothetical protein